MTAPTRTRRQQPDDAPRPRRTATAAKASSAKGSVTREATEPARTEPARRRQPVRTQPQPRRRTQTRGTQTQRGRTTAAERAYARRAQRAEEIRRVAETLPKPEAKRTGLSRFRPRSRASFVLVMMGLLAIGVATTLWLSTQAIADSYKLEEIRQTNAGLAEHAEMLQREVTQQDSASALANKAKQLGMVPGGDPARIVVNPDGSTRVVGEPKKAAASASSPAASGQSAQQPGTPQGGRPMEGDVSQAGEEPDGVAAVPPPAGQAAPQSGGR
jgi:hypothetical protein